MIERAGIWFGMMDAELRSRCRNAPEFVRVNIDMRRRERGAPPLWPELGRRSDKRSSGRLAERLRILKAYVEAKRKVV